MKWKIILIGATLVGFALYLASPTEVTITVDKPEPMTAPRWST